MASRRPPAQELKVFWAGSAPCLQVLARPRRRIESTSCSGSIETELLAELWQDTVARRYRTLIGVADACFVEDPLGSEHVSGRSYRRGGRR